MARKQSRRSARPGTPEARGEAPEVAVVESLEAVGLTVITEQDFDEVEASYEGAEVEAVAETPTETELTRQTVTQRCAEAKEMGACGCRCRGKYHGTEHPEGWKEEPGCEPLSKDERKAAKRETLKAWRRNHPDRVSAYMKKWRETSAAPTAVKAREAAAKREAEQKGGA